MKNEKKPYAKNIARRAAVITALCAVCLTLSGCLDIFQCITRLDSGADSHIIKVDISRSGFNMIAQSGSYGESPMNFEILADYCAGYLDYFKEYGAAPEQIITEQEASLIIKTDISYNPQTMERIIAEKPAFIPLYTPEGMIIPVSNILSNYQEAKKEGLRESLGEYYDNLDEAALDDEYLEYLTLVGHYRLLLSKRCLATVARATVSGEYGEEETELSVIDLGAEYLIEAPLRLLLQNNERYIKIYTN